LGDALVPDGRIDENLEDKIQANPEELRLHDKVLKRVQASVPTSPSSDLQGLIGEYGWDHDILYVLEKDGKLNVLIEWFEYDPLQQVTDNIFKFPDHGLYDGETATFTRDPSGRATQVAIGAVIFKRRPQAKEQGGIFQITPPRPVAEMRREALAAQPPRETGSFRAPDLVDVTALDPAIHLDIRYATNRNFLGTPVYSQAKAFLQRPAAEALARASRTLHRSGYGLLIHDAYRPWYVTKIFWDATPADKKIFVADPKEGSRHNRGCAVDLTVYNLRTGQEVPMTGGYDEMSERSYAFYPGGTSLQRWDRALLRDAMEKEGFRVYDYEWWHFDYQDWRQYPILNVTFEQLAAKHASESSRVPPDSAKR
jgi:D-alanyl-D-alanine dipeptidase